MIELNRSRNNVVLSRRAVLEDERKEMRQAILDRLNPGDVVEGTISNIVDFGAFVDLDGMDGLIHISELSWSHVNHPSEVLEIGQKVNVKVLDIDRDRQRISLGLKQTQSDPWQQVLESYQEGDVVAGQGDEGRHVRRLRRDPPGRRGPRAHLGARAAPRREPARGRLAGRHGERAHPRGRRGTAAPVAVAEARRGRDAHPACARATRPCRRRSTCRRTSSRTSRLRRRPASRLPPRAADRASRPRRAPRGAPSVEAEAAPSRRPSARGSRARGSRRRGRLSTSNPLRHPRTSPLRARPRPRPNSGAAAARGRDHRGYRGRED